MPRRNSNRVIPQDTQSIFSETLYGVPSPTIPHTHPYPTRFHGPIYHYPRFFLPYQEQSYQVPPEWVGPGLIPKWPEHIPFGADGSASSGTSFIFGMVMGGVLGLLAGALLVGHMLDSEGKEKGYVVIGGKSYRRA
jgi:hypothetical protein